MSSLQVSVRLNPSFDEWYGAKTVIQEELQAIGKALERIRISSQLQDAFTGHLFAVHRQWCEACPSAREPGLSGGGLQKEAPTNIPTRAAAAHTPMKPKKTSVSCVSTFTQTTDVNGLYMNVQGEVDDNNDDISETPVPSSMTCRVEDEESRADVNRTLEKPSSLKGTFVSPNCIKSEVSEGVQLRDVLLKLEENHCDVDMESSKEEKPSQQIHEEELPLQHIESGEQSHLERTNTVSDQHIKPEKDSQGHCDLRDMAGSSSEAMSHQGTVEEIPLERSDGQLHLEGMDTVSDQLIKHEVSHGHSNFDMAGSSSEAMSHPGPVEEIPHDRSDGKLHLENMNEVSDQHIEHERDSQGHCDLRDMAGSSSEAMSHQGPAEEIPLDRSDGTSNTISALNCDVLGQEGVFKDPCLDSYKKVQKTSRTDINMKKCSHCSKMYSCMKKYQKHLSTHTCQKPYQCSVCSKRFTKKVSFETHMMEHKGEKPFKCDHCSYQCLTKETLNDHMRMHTESMSYTCSFCDKIFNQKVDMERHMMIHIGEKPFKCDHCSYRSAKKSNLMVHMRAHTSTAKRPYKCDYCTYSCLSKQNFEIHMRTHSGKKPYSCDICDYRCFRKGSLTVHMRVHTGEKPHQCSFCGKRFTQPSHLKTHMRTHSGEKTHQCSVCGKRFTGSSNFRSHIKIHTGEKPYRCDICDYRCSRKGILAIHMRVHTGEKPHQCSLCGKRFSQLIHMKLHMRTHSGEKPYSCDICDYRCSQKRSLTVHMRVHTGEKPNECSICEKRFMHSGNLKRHMMIHTGEKPYRCDICDFRCFQKGHLARHMRVHTGEKP